jgi:thioredoxin reductase
MPKRNRMNFDKHYDAIVLGGGPAGLAAGIYLSRARMKTLIISEGIVGGQMILTHEIANYPGVESISGYQLATVYAAGDSIAKRYRQITTAVSDGTIAALAASEYLNKLKKEEKQLISN